MNCPFCGAQIGPQPWERQAVAQGWEQREYHTFNAGTINAALASGATYEHKKPTRPARLDSDVLVPFWQSVISGAVGALVVGCGSALIGAGWRSFLWAGVGGAGALGLAWVVILGEHRLALFELEKLIGRDLTGDGVTGRPAPVPQVQREPVRVEVIERNERGLLRRVRFVDFPPNITDGDLHRLAVAVLQDGCEFSRRGLADAVSPDKYAAVFRPLLRGGLLRYANGRNVNNGFEITPSGRSFLRQYEVE